jgi:hypothetical protein
MIYAAGSMYMKMNGKWSLASSIKDLEESEQPPEKIDFQRHMPLREG